MRAIALAAVLLLATEALAADWSEEADAPGRAASQSYRAMQGAIAVRPLDNADLAMEIAKRLADALRQRGITVSDDAPLLLEFETRTESSVHDVRREPRDAPRDVDIGRQRDLGRSDAVDARVDVYSSARSSILTGVRPPDRGMRYSLRATVSERTGPRLWEGYTEYGEIATDEVKLYAAMVPLLASMVGQSTGERRFRADR